jgi:shikimate kinase
VNSVKTISGAIVLVGPPGSGKTSAGRILAARLGWSFTDTDALIEEQAGLKVSALFAQHGERHFRRLESAVLMDLVRQQPTGCVIATGGGIMITGGNYELMCRLGPVVCLMGAVETLVTRLSGDSTRPLLATAATTAYDPANQDALRQKLTDLLLTRWQAYAVPQYRVDSDNLTPEEVADAVMRRLQLC